MDSLTEGKIFKPLLLFSIPILLGNLFQQLYNIVDTVVVGHVMGDVALAAVGSAGTLYALFLYFITGLTSGFSIIIAKYYGEKDNEMIKKSFALSLLYGVLISVLITVIALIFMPQILAILNTKKEIYNYCYSYICFVMIFLFVTMLYNLEACTLRALGDSKTPLYFLIISSLINVVLDYVLIAFCNMGVLGAAVATIIAQFISSILCFIHILKHFPVLKISKADFVIEKDLSLEMLSLGTSMGFSSCLVSIGSLILQSSINSFDTMIITAHTAARKVDELMMMPLVSFSLALATFISQNVGAKKPERIKDGVKDMIYIDLIWSVICIGIVFLFARPILHALSGSTNEVVLNTASTYLKVNIPFFPALSLLFIFRCGLQGLAKKTVPMFSSFIEFAGKILTVAILVPKFQYFGIMISEPIVWIACAIVCLTAFIKYYHDLLKDS